MMMLQNNQLADADSIAADGQIRKLMKLQGFSDNDVDQAAYGKSSNVPVRLQRDPTEQEVVSEPVLDLLRAQGVIDDMRADPDDVKTADNTGVLNLADFISELPDHAHKHIHGFRAAWRNFRKTTSINAAQDINDARDWLHKAVGKVMGSPVTHTALGLVEPALRPQQVMFGLMSGEGWRAFERMTPKVRIPGDDGTEISPFQAALQTLNTNYSDNRDLTFEQAQENVVNVSQEHLGQILQFRDVLNSWSSKANVDAAAAAWDAGGKLMGPGGLHVPFSVVTGAVDIFGDPLLLSAGLPTKGVEALRGGLSSATAARRTAAVAARKKTLVTMQEATLAAERHLDTALKMHKLEGTEHSFKRLSQAEAHYSDTIANMRIYEDVVDVDPILPIVAKRNPSTLEANARPVSDSVLRVTKPKPAGDPFYTLTDVRRAKRNTLDMMHTYRISGLADADPDGLAKFATEFERLETIEDNWARGYRPGREFTPGKEVETQRMLQEMDSLGEHMDIEMARLTDAGLSEEIEAVQTQRRQLEKWKVRLVEDGYDAVPEVLEFQGKVVRTRTVDELAEIQRLDRLAAAERPTTAYQPRADEEWQLNLFAEEDAEVAARMAQGPDDAEYVAEGLGRIADGAEIDDLAVPSMWNPEQSHMTGGRIVPGTIDGLISASHLEKMAVRDLSRGPNLVMEGPEFAGKQIKQGTLLQDAAKYAQANKVKMDQAWLPTPTKPLAERLEATWRDGYGTKMFDRMAPALYPESWQYHAPGLQGLTNMFREPMRVLEGTDPGRSWPIFRNAMMNQRAETSRLNALFNQELERFGAMTVKEPTTLKKIVMSGARKRAKVNDEMSKKLFDLLETPVGSEEYAKLAEDLTSEQLLAATNIRTELRHIADKLGITGTDLLVEDYMPHAIDRSVFERGGVQPELRGLGRNGNILLSHLLRRRGAGTPYKRDAVAALDIYARGVGRKLYMEPALQELDAIATDIAKTTGNYSYRANVDMILSQAKGEPSQLGKVVDHAIGTAARTMGIGYSPGGVSRKLMGIAGMSYAGVLSGNPRYPLMALATNVVTTGARFGTFRTLKGLFAMGTPEGQAVFKTVGGDAMWGRIFEENSPLSGVMNSLHDLAIAGKERSLRKAIRAGAEGADASFGQLTRMASKLRAGTPSIEDVEFYIRGVTFWAAIDENLTKLGFESLQAAEKAGFSNKIMFDAVRQTEEVNHFFGVSGKPALFSKISKSGSAVSTQFLAFTPKQIEQLVSTGLQNPGYIMRYMMLSGWAAGHAAQDFGLDLSDYVGLGFLKGGGIPDVTTPGTEFLLSNMRAMAAMSSLYAGGGSMEDAATAMDDLFQSGEAMVPFLNAARTRARQLEAFQTGEMTRPGEGVERKVQLENRGPGQRGENLAMALGVKSVEETTQQQARRQVRAAMDDAAFERYAMVEKLGQSMESGDTADAMKQLQRLVALGVPMGDITDPMVARAEAQRLYWHVETIKRNPSMWPIIVPMMKEAGILGGSQ